MPESLNKVPEVTLIFWIIKIAATTLGETGGDTVTMTLNWGYLAGTALFLAALVLLISLQIIAKKFHPFLYWATIIASTTCGTTMADFADRSLGIGYAGGSTLLLVLLLVTLGLWYWSWLDFGGHREHTESGNVLLGGHHLLANPRHRTGRLDRQFHRPWL